MRLRYKPWAEEMLAANDHIVIANPELKKGKWREEFGSDKPIHIEVGSGKGQFITGMAQRHPDIHYIGIELYKSVLVSALELQLEGEAPMPNVRLLNVDGAELERYFAPGEVDRVYLNFSDPWPKARHAKRRLTHETFLGIYERILRPEATLHFKTDNRGLFEYSLVSLSQYGMRLLDVSLDLHAEMPEGNVMTEYEQKFSAKGQPIYRLEARYPRRNEKR